MDTYSTGLSGKAGLVEETLVTFQLVIEGYKIDHLRTAIIDDDVLGKATYSTRETIWKKIKQRYLSDWDKGKLLAKMVDDVDSWDAKRQLLYYEFCKCDAVLYDAITEPVWERYNDGYSSVDVGKLQDWIDQSVDSHPEVLEWSPQTRKKVLSNVITVLRDFGLMSGKTRKVFENVYLSLPVFGYVLYRIKEMSEMIGPQSIIEHPDWRLFLKDEDDVLALLDDASAAGYCTFKRQGSVMTLTLQWPNLGGYVEAITGKI